MAREIHKHRAQQARVVKESPPIYGQPGRTRTGNRSLKQRELGQFLTPAPIAEFMASVFANREKEVRLLDAGAGAGALIQAFVEGRCACKPLPTAIHVVAYEVDDSLLVRLHRTLEQCRQLCLVEGVHFSAEVRNADFIEGALPLLGVDLFQNAEAPFNATILNPPYRKINSSSRARLLLRSAGIETSNLYTGFLALAAKLLCENGEMVAIIPRSFANSLYFRPFRDLFLN